jgi:hypothetical protein
MIPRSAIFAVLAAVAVAATGCNNRSTGPTGPSGLSGLEPGTPSRPEVCLDPDGNPLPIAPDSERVDLDQPTFSNPTRVTNPLFPIGGLFRAVFYGKVDGAPLRLETTLLSETRTLNVDGSHRGERARPGHRGPRHPGAAHGRSAGGQDLRSWLR